MVKKWCGAAWHVKNGAHSCLFNDDLGSSNLSDHWDPRNCVFFGAHRCSERLPSRLRFQPTTSGPTSSPTGYSGSNHHPDQGAV